MTNLVISFTNVVFAATLETAPTITGPWTASAPTISACAEAKSFEVQANEPVAFFRLRLHDNGRVPTPGKPKAFLVGGSVELVSQQPLFCQQNPVLLYRWYRDGSPIGTSTDGTFTDSPPSGFHLYQVRAESAIGESWLTEYTEAYSL